MNKTTSEKRGDLRQEYYKQTKTYPLDNLEAYTNWLEEKIVENLALYGVVSSATSKDYNRLYDKISKGEIVPCFVDYDWRDGTPPLRDVASVKMRPDKTVIVGARGIQYGGVDSWHLETKKPLIAFTEECERMNLEYYT